MDIFGDEAPDTSPTTADTSEPPTIHDDEYVLIPAYDIAVNAGHGMFSDGATNPSKHLAFRKRWVQARNLSPQCLAVLFTEGDSMVPTIPDGSAIVIDKSRTTALDGKLYVIRIDDRLYVKRTQWLINGDLSLISDNTNTTPPKP